MPQYGEPDYWDKRYSNQKEKTFDWLENWASLKPTVEKLIDKDARILMLGCGNALISQEMYDDGYKNIANIDISSVCIENMKERNFERSEMTWEVMDVTDIKYDDQTFDLAIDKSTIDALLCGDDSFLNVAKMTKEVQRVLKTGGYYFVISYGQPDNRNHHFLRPHLDFNLEYGTVYPVDCKEEDKINKEHYIYTCQKGPKADENCEAHWEEVETELIEEAENKMQIRAAELD
ncbi:unnamed protein product [Moneuplotes crassus]|uniref:Methyltransferase domain-containing protein n=2 Tax=Euplotes crassus TaxID=5936 RepID=A0AAD1XS37_EUPCR|nr:unnamed protein product [Moneuplotes crassus]